MAFEDFQETKPVIILGKNVDGIIDEDARAIYERTCIVDGMEAKPSVFNTSIMDAINRDISLENALTYLARCAALYTTNNTTFLSHCEGDGIDVVGFKPPYMKGSQASDIFVKDSTFLGAAYPQGRVENMIRPEQYSAVDSTYPHVDGHGWSYTLSDNWELEKNIIAKVDTLDNKLFTLVTTRGITAPQILPGFITFKTNKLSLSAGGGTYTPSVFSAGIKVKTSDNMVEKATAVEFRLTMLPSAGTDTPPSDDCIIIKKIENLASFDGVIKMENITVPEGIRTQTAPVFIAEITFSFLDSGSEASFQVSQLMVQEGGVLSPWVVDSRDVTYCEYQKVLDISDNKSASVIFWCKTQDFVLRKMSSTESITPLFVSFNDNVSFGGIHLGDDGENLVMRLAINNNGEMSYSPSYITVPSSYINKYILCCIRMTPKDDTYYTVEFAVAVEDKVYPVSMDIERSVIEQNVKGTLVVGCDKPLDATFEQHCISYEGYVTEIRIDNEWVNDMELYLMNLGHKPFSYKQSTDSQITTEEKTTTEIIDSAGINLIQNPTGRYALICWNGFEDVSGFTVMHNNVNLGNCFYYTGTAASNVIVYSDIIPVTPNSIYSLRGVMLATPGGTGEIGIGLRWLKDGEVFNPAASMVNDTQLLTTFTGKATYYSTQKASLTDTRYAVVYMFVKAGSSTAGIGWAKMKLEKGQPTFFTDDSGANYGVYY